MDNSNIFKSLKISEGVKESNLFEKIKPACLKIKGYESRG